MKVVVTGGSGQLGRRVVAELTAHGHAVLSLDRAPQPDGFRPSWLADLLTPGSLYEACIGADAIVHLAAFIAPNLTSDTSTFNANMAMTYNVLKVASDLKLHRVVQASSTAAYGFLYGPAHMVPEYLPIHEDHSCRPVDPYGLSKVLGERTADSFVQSSALTVASLRFPGITFDPEFKQLLQRQSDPGARRSGFWAYVDFRDAAKACRLALEAKIRGHRIFNVAAPTSSMREPTSELIARYLPGLDDLWPGADPRWSGVDSARAEHELGFRADYLWENL